MRFKRPGSHRTDWADSRACYLFACCSRKMLLNLNRFTLISAQDVFSSLPFSICCATTLLSSFSYSNPNYPALRSVSEYAERVV